MSTGLGHLTTETEGVDYFRPSRHQNVRMRERVYRLVAEESENTGHTRALAGSSGIQGSICWKNKTGTPPGGRGIEFKRSNIKTNVSCAAASSVALLYLPTRTAVMPPPR